MAKPKTGLARAAARVGRPGASELPEHADGAIKTFLREVGGQQALADVLAVTQSEGELSQVTQLLLDPRYDGVPLSHLCRLAGLTVADVFVAYRKALVTRAHIQAAVLIAAKIPAVVDDVMTRAAPHQVPCTVCKGLGSLAPVPTEADPNPNPTPCAACKGVGSFLELPDLDRQKLALELGQLTQKGGGIYVQQNNIPADAAGRALGSNAPGALEQLQQAVGELLYRQPPAAAPEEPTTDPDSPPVILDAEPLDDPPA